MANSYSEGDAGVYPTRHNKRELKVIETAKAFTPSAATDFTTLPGTPAAPNDADDAINKLAAASPKVSYSAAAADDFAIATGDGVTQVVVNDAIAVTLPPAADNVGRSIYFCQRGSATLTITQNADGANIAGADASYTALDAANDFANLYCDGTEWILFGTAIA
jgi:DNA topoisomerase IB